MAVPFRTRVLRLLLAVLLPVSLLPSALANGADPVAPDHLVVSEIVTGGAAAVDELIELYNPTAGALPLEGLELVYVSASGVTVSRRAAWDLGAPEVPPGGHVLVAHQDGLFAPIADATYTSGMAATGGSVAIRIQGGSTLIDAAGWGTASGAYLEGAAAPAPASGASLERLPGGSSGSTQDTDDNAADFVLRPVPDPQNLGSPPTPDPDGPPPTVTPDPTASPTPGPTVAPIETPVATATPVSPAVTSVGAARGLPDGTVVTIEGTALTDAAFHDGGGFVVDATGGIAVLVDGGTFARGDRLRISGEIGDRFSQRTLRAAAADVTPLGPGAEPAPVTRATGSIGEAVEGTLARVSGSLIGSGSTLTTGRAFDLDDGTGVVRLVIGTATGIDTASWTSGTQVDLVGVIGQRDSTGSGVTGYRVMPRDPADVVSATVSATPAPSASASVGASATPGASGSPSPDSVTIAAARSAAKNAKVTVSGVVTLGSGIVDEATAVIQDATGAIVLRLGADAGSLATGERVEVDGTRSTLAGMETLRVTQPPRRIGTAALPEALAVRTGDAGEAHEARLVEVRGAVVANARRASSGSVSFDLDDGSGPLRVVLAAALGADSASLPAGTWVEVTGVLGQETTGAMPASGYRVWPAAMSGLRVLAAPTDEDGGGGGGGGNGSSGDGGGSEPPAGSLDELENGIDGLRIGATLVAGHWPELGIAGLLWDGVRLAAIEPASADIVAELAADAPIPMALDLGRLQAVGTEPVTGIGMVALGREPGDVVRRDASPQPPTSIRTAGPAWATVIGPVTGAPDALSVRVGSRSIELDRRCESETSRVRGVVAATGIALGEPTRLMVPCGGIQPAPVLARTSQSAIGPSVGGEAATVAPAASDPTFRRLAAGGLMAAAMMLGGVAAILRQRRPDDPDDALEPSEADDEPHTLDDASAEPPKLTLVSVTREHGS